jgi:hypothetical protein
MLIISITVQQSHVLMFSISVELREYVQMHAMELVPVEEQLVIVGQNSQGQIAQYNIEIIIKNIYFIFIVFQ